MLLKSILAVIVIAAFLAFVLNKIGFLPSRMPKAPVKPTPPWAVKEHPFTREEQKVMEHLVQAHNDFMKLEPSGQEQREWIDSLHRLQDLLGRRVLKRDYPNTFN